MYAPNVQLWDPDRSFFACIAIRSTFLSNRQSAEGLATVVCVKWGSKYGAEYVNRLAAGVQRNLTLKHRIVCFTDDREGIDEGIDIATLPLVDDLKVCRQRAPSCRPMLHLTCFVPRWQQGWWYKAHLFSREACEVLGEGTQVLYVDLDTVVVGSLDELARVRGPFFGVLSTDMMVSERRSGGFNSSVMMWPAGTFTEIWMNLLQHRGSVKNITYKFDGWIEMILPLGAVKLLQTEVSCLLLEYGQVKKAGGDVPEGACLVTFPLKPKPHECIESNEWVNLHWR
jgi:hypothetical protein